MPRGSDAVLDTAETHSRNVGGGVLELLDRPLEQERLDAPVEVFYTNPGFWPAHRPVADMAHAERLLASTTPEEPWVTFVRPFALGGSIDGPHFYFQILADHPGHILIEGGGCRGGDIAWNWTSSFKPIDRRPAQFGPTWFRIRGMACEVQTISDALVQLRPALLGSAIPRGYLWLPVSRTEIESE